ncbi:MAG TPA: tRNA (adenosine(37)-N6)-threonylcarbamoyltransferase complex dimerization subunit type 1 TsaB [Candidatus Dormibacteraeota bacterium]|nr:tRNA (adenosine(37)-N6)-threonylcarbamoyltransferase complex dimerization subunit type 1 TsaB [Candidatus Dormibacteraeota bacterium]
MILAIDTSSACSAVALVKPGGGVAHEELAASGPAFDLPSRYRALMGGAALTGVAVATGPGSFTGLRVGVSFGLGLAIGLRIPIYPLPTLRLQAARSDAPVLAVSEAGRGRVYHLAPGGATALGEASELPREWPAVGWLRDSTRAALEAGGIRFAGEDDLRTFGEAAAILLETAREVTYGSVEIEYMQSFRARG